jgi:DNA-binding CsgD family transcriptional regulator
MSGFDLIQFLTDMNNEKSTDKSFAILSKACATVGLDRLVYSLINPHNTINMEAGHAIVGNYPEDWMQHYTKKRYEQIDPVIKYIKQYEGIFRWDDLELLNAINNEKELVLMNEAKEAGLHSGLGLSLKNYHGEIVGMGFASSFNKVALDVTTQQFILLVSKQFDLNFKTISLDKKHRNKKFAIPTCVLTPRQKDILCWIAKDKTYNEIASILNITENTILYHTKGIFKRLGVQSQMSAVLKAIKLGLITP